MKDNNSLSPKKLRIAFFGARGVPHNYGGFETFLYELTPRLVERGHEVTVYNRSALFREKPKSYKGVRLIYLPSIETKSLGTPVHSMLAATDAAFRNFDIVMAVNVANVFQLLLPRLFGKLVACNVDGLDWKRGKWGPIGKAFFYSSARCAGWICPRSLITDAAEMHRIYREDFGASSACIAYGASTETSSDPAIVRKYGLVPGQYYLVVSRMVPENNSDLIVDAFKRITTDRVLAIAGDANYRNPFLEALKRSAGPRVRFLGHINNFDHLKELYCNSYAYVHGHMLGGTNPALLKALGYGNMVLALNTVFNQEVLQDFGMLFENNPADLAAKLQFIEDNPATTTAYRRRASQRIHRTYTWDHITDQYEEFFLQLANGEDPTRVHSSILGMGNARAEAGVAQRAAGD